MYVFFVLLSSAGHSNKKSQIHAHASLSSYFSTSTYCHASTKTGLSFKVSSFRTMYVTVPLDALLTEKTNFCAPLGHDTEFLLADVVTYKSFVGLFYIVMAFIARHLAQIALVTGNWIIFA